LANRLWQRGYPSLVAGGLFLLMVFVILAGNTGSPRTPYSPDSPEENGTKALVLLMRELGNPFIMGSQLKGEKGTGLFFPGEGTSAREVNFLIEWVQKGNRLLVAGDERNIFFQDREIHVDPYPFGNLAHKGQPGKDRFYFSQVQELSLTPQGRFAPASPGEVLAADDLGPWLIRQQEGKGEILFLSVPRIFTNGHLDQADNLIFVLNLFRGDSARERGPLYLYRPEMGTETLGPVGAWLRDRKYLFLGELMLGLVLLFHFWGKRFGRVIPLQAAEAPEKDYGSSMAELYRFLGAKDLVLGILTEDLRLFMARRFGLSRSAGIDEILKELRRDRPQAADSLAKIFQDAEAFQTKQSWTEARLVHMARQLERWRKENFEDAPS